MAEQVVRVEKVERQIGKLWATIEITLVWDPEAAERIKAAMVRYMIAKAPEILAKQKETVDAPGQGAGHGATEVISLPCAVRR